MSTERIAFMFPVNVTEHGTKGTPFLVFDVDSLPVNMDVVFRIFMVGLTAGKPYKLTSQICLEGPQGIETSISGSRSVNITASDSQGHPEDLAASVDLTFHKCQFLEPGNYFLQSVLASDSEELNDAKCYFKVSKE